MSTRCSAKVRRPQGMQRSADQVAQVCALNGFPVLEAAEECTARAFTQVPRIEVAARTLEAWLALVHGSDEGLDIPPASRGRALSQSMTTCRPASGSFGHFPAPLSRSGTWARSLYVVEVHPRGETADGWPWGGEAQGTTSFPRRWAAAAPTARCPADATKRVAVAQRQADAGERQRPTATRPMVGLARDGRRRSAARSVVASSTAVTTAGCQAVGANAGAPRIAGEAATPGGINARISEGMKPNSHGPVGVSPNAPASRPRYHRTSSGEAGDRHGFCGSRRRAPSSRSAPNRRMRSARGSRPWLAARASRTCRALGWKAGQHLTQPCRIQHLRREGAGALGRGTGEDVEPPQLGQDAQVAEIVILERAN